VRRVDEEVAEVCQGCPEPAELDEALVHPVGFTREEVGSFGQVGEERRVERCGSVVGI
jgi:hypothetical protein